jgi:hypothetical protein
MNNDLHFYVPSTDEVLKTDDSLYIISTKRYDYIHQALLKKHTRNYPSFYVAIDWHGTLTKSTYLPESSLDFYPYTLEALTLMKNKNITLILSTCSHQHNINDLQTTLSTHNLKFDYINENPEIISNTLSNFDDKYYYDIFLDDKAGFVPTLDWKEIINIFENTEYL